MAQRKRLQTLCKNKTKVKIKLLGRLYTSWQFLSRIFYIFIVAHKWNFGRKKKNITVALTITKNDLKLK